MPTSHSANRMVPPLIQDLSPSDESDEAVVTPPGAGIPAIAPAARGMSIHLPDSPKTRKSSPPFAPLSLPPSPASRCVRPGRPKPTRSFSPRPNLDEGCLGGF